MYDSKSTKKQTTSNALNKTGIPSNLKKTIEQTHNLSLNDIRVHYNSQKPQQFHAHAYTQGSNIYISPGQEKYLSHELGHVIQQMNNSIKPTLKINGVNINNNPVLEHEANLLGNCIIHSNQGFAQKSLNTDIVQCFFCEEGTANALIEQLLDKETNKIPNTLKNLSYSMRKHGILSDDGIIEYSGHDNTFILFEQNSPHMFLSPEKLCTFLKKRVSHNNNSEIEQIYSEVPFGNEFTFRSNDRRTDFDLKALLQKNNKCVVAANDIIKSWLDHAPESIKVYNNSTLSYVYFCKKIYAGNKKWTDAPYDARRIEYTSFDQDHNPIFSWGFNIDLDPGCIEIQTDPITFKDFKYIRPLFDEAIFNIAFKKHLFADTNPDTGGGGHISLDKKGAFMDNAHYLRNFLVLYANESADKNSFVQKCTDTLNAPFLFDLGRKAVNNFKNAISNFDKLPQEEQTINKLVSIVQTDVYKGQFMEQLAEAIKSQQSLTHLTPDLAYHYQAINLEHMLRTDSGAHIEMRRYNAQNGTEELKSQLCNLLQLLLLSRKKQSLPFKF